jgi:outer membrane lipopolysaccharide assembly protein LptE/RlpB
VTSRSIALLATVLLLVGCGYRPAGTLEVDTLAGTRVIDAAGETDVAFAISRQLDLYGVPEPAADMGSARTLRVLDESWERRQLTVRPDARTAEWELTGSARFELLGADGGTLIEPRTVRADAVWQRDPANLLGSSNEERRLREEITDDLVRRILSAVSVTSGGAVSRPSGG